MAEPRVIKLFVASPGDVMNERERLDLVLARLNTTFAKAARFERYRWEHSFYTANKGFQDQIPEPTIYDIVVVIFGSRLGTELPEYFEKRQPDGSQYPSGTAYEFISAITAAEQSGKPAVYVFRDTAELHFALSQEAEWALAQREKKRLDAFFERWFFTEAGSFRRAFHRFKGPIDFEKQAEGLLRQWTEKWLSQLAEKSFKSPSAGQSNSGWAEKALRAGPKWQVDIDGSPFRGLKPFDARQSRVFFGRDRSINRAIEELVRAPNRERGRPFLLVVGPSGAGKSSLVRAGVIPVLTTARIVPEVDIWRIAVMRPAGATPFASLAEALYFNPASQQIEDDPGGFGRALPELAEGPRQSPADIAELLDTTPASATASILAALDSIGEREKLAGAFTRDVRVDLVLLVDHLEEIFDNHVSQQDRVAFSRLLTALTDSKRVWVVATLRSDHYSLMLESKSSIFELKDGGSQYDLAAPGEAELAEIVGMSAEAAGFVYETNNLTGDTLGDRLLRDAEGSGTLPLLQFSLEKLFEQWRAVGMPEGPRAQITYAAYDAQGGLYGAIDMTAEAAIRSLDSNSSSIEIDRTLRRLLPRLATRFGDDPATTALQSGLRLRAATFAEAAPDAISRNLVDVLVRARLLVPETAVLAGPSVRLAHECVLTSWRRARAIVEARSYLTYFWVRADIEQQYRRWADGGYRRELLLARGTPLYDAESFVRDYGDDLPPTLSNYVAISGRRARWRQRFTAAAAAVFFIVAVIATAFALVAYSAEQQAALNFAAAMGAADDLVSSIANQSKYRKGVSTDTLDITFGAVEGLLQKVKEAASPRGGFATRELPAAFAWIAAHWFGTPANVGDLAAIERSQATFLYEFAKAYNQSANDLTKARRYALESLEIQTRLRNAGNSSPDLDVAIAMTEMELGDIERKAIEDAQPIKHDGTSVADFSAARAHYEAALSLLAPLASQIAARPDWASDESKLLTRLGDLDMKAGDRKAAEQRYAPAQTLALRALRASPNDLDALNELAWSYRKLGEAESDSVAAQKNFACEVCLRRRLAELRPTDVIYAQDLGYALMWLGRTRTQSQPPDLPGAQDAFSEAFYVMLNLLEKDKSKKAFFDEFGLALQGLSDSYRLAGNSELAAAFKSASDDVARNASELFADLPADDPARGQAVERKKLLQQRDPMDMIEKARETVAIQEHEFEVSRLPALRRDAEGCWQRLQQNAAEFDVGTEPAK
jgi:hypothetical protein